MGWQGTMRFGRGARIFEKMPTEIQREHTFIYASCWRDNKVAYLMLEEKASGDFVWIKVSRDSGEPLPMSGVWKARYTRAEMIDRLRWRMKKKRAGE